MLKPCDADTIQCLNKTIKSGGSRGLTAAECCDVLFDKEGGVCNAPNLK